MLLIHWIQLCLLLTLSESIYFEFPVFIPLVLYLIRSVSVEDSLNCISRIRFRCSFFACNNFLFRAFVTMIYWESTEVLLNVFGPLDLPVSSLDFEQINLFWTSGFDSVSIVFELLSLSRRLPKSCCSLDLDVSLFDFE